MGLDDIKDQLRDQANALWGRIQESSAFNSLKEQYETWPTVVQRSLTFVAGFLAVLVVLSIPYSYIDSASLAVDEFTEYRTLLRDLLRVGRASKEVPALPPGMSSGELASQTQGMLGEFMLVADQIGGVTPLPDRPAPSLAPPVIQQAGVAVTLKKLNLYQVIDIGYRLQNMSSGIKLTGLDMTANAEDNHYYDVTYRVVNFSLPAAPEEPPAAGGRGKDGGDE